MILLMKDMHRLEEAEEQYKLAIEANPNDSSTHSNYGVLLYNMGRMEEAENQYKLALEADPNDSSTHSNYGLLLCNMGCMTEAEEQYKLAIEANPNDSSTHSNYGILLYNMGRMEEAENQYKLAIKLDPKYPNSHGAYGLLLLSMNSEKKAIEETNIASHLYRENKDHVKEHLTPAWLYEKFANKYYNLKDYIKSGEYAEIAGNEYIEAGKHSGEKSNSTFLTKGYTLKGRAKIRKLDIKPSLNKRIIKRINRKKVSYDVEIFTNVIDCIQDASICYKKAAEVSPKNNALCNACSISMSCLSEMIDFMLAVINKKAEMPELKDKFDHWKSELIVCKEVYKGNPKGEAFLNSLDNLMNCIKNLEVYKIYGMRKDERAFEEYVKELREVAMNIEGPLQKVIEDSTKRMDQCKQKIIPYQGTPSSDILNTPPETSQSNISYRISASSTFLKKSISFRTQLLISMFTTIVAFFIIIPTLEESFFGLSSSTTTIFGPLSTYLLSIAFTLTAMIIIRKFI